MAIDYSKTLVFVNGKPVKIKSAYIGVNGNAVKVWDAEKGVIEAELNEKVEKAVAEYDAFVI